MSTTVHVHCSTFNSETDCLLCHEYNASDRSVQRALRGQAFALLESDLTIVVPVPLSDGQNSADPPPSLHTTLGFSTCGPSVNIPIAVDSSLIVFIQ